MKHIMYQGLLGTDVIQVGREANPTGRDASIDWLNFPCGSLCAVEAGEAGLRVGQS